MSEPDKKLKARGGDMDAPKRIWAWTFKDCDWKSAWTVADEDAPPHATAYIRADIAAPDLAELVEALRFYADPTYNGYDVNIGNYGLSMQAGEIIKDAGDRARAALAKIKEPQT